jgi:hypothetical protein
MAFNETCFPKLIFLTSDSSPPPLWTPDIIFKNAKKNDLGLPNDGSLMEVYPSGQVYWSQRIRMTVNCKFHLGRLPWDTQSCGLAVGLHAQVKDEVDLVWKEGEKALPGLELQTMIPDWTIGEEGKANVDVPRQAGVKPEAHVWFVLSRKPESYILHVVNAFFFVVLQYFGWFINPAAVPGRVTLNIIIILIVQKQMTAIDNSIPTVSYPVWLVDFMFGMMILNIGCFCTFVIVNFARQADAYLKKPGRAEGEGHKILGFYKFAAIFKVSTAASSGDACVRGAERAW